MVEEIVTAAAMCLIEQPAKLRDEFQRSLAVGYMLQLKREHPGMGCAERRRHAKAFLHEVNAVAKHMEVAGSGPGAQQNATRIP